MERENEGMEGNWRMTIWRGTGECRYGGELENEGMEWNWRMKVWRGTGE